MTADLRDRIVDRQPFGENDGASGALLERATLDDGTPIVLKTYDPETDLTMRISGASVPVEVELWRGGVLDRIPAPMAHAVLSAWADKGRWTVAMSDLGTALFTYESSIELDACRRVLAAADRLHEGFRGADVAGLWPLDRRLTLLAPRTMSPFARGDNPLPNWVLEGWRRFDAVVPDDVASIVHRIHASPELLTDPLQRLGGTTLLHGDYWLPNLALTDSRVVAIDWGLATSGPAVVEFTAFLVGCASQVTATKEQILEEMREVWGSRHDETLLRIGLIGGMVEMGWNIAWHAVENPGDATADQLHWWTEATRVGLATGLLG